jgi:Skp family chaperone for outer membrane proteins
MTMIKTSFFAVLLTSAAVSVPASAQVAGIATADTTDAIMTAKAFSQAYQQIGATFKSNGDLMNQKRREMNDINAQLDINKDKNLTQDELDAAIKAKNPLLTQLDAKEREIAQLQQPIVSAQAFALENIAAKYGAAQQAVVTAKKINLVISPDVVLYAPNTIDITAAIVTELDKIIPVAPITPPADWRPQGSTEPLYQQVQQRLMQAARIQAMRAQQVTQGGQPAVPGAAPAAPAPKAPDDGR